MNGSAPRLRPLPRGCADLTKAMSAPKERRRRALPCRIPCHARIPGPPPRRAISSRPVGSVVPLPGAAAGRSGQHELLAPTR